MKTQKEAFKAWFKKEYLGIDDLAKQGDEGAITRRDYAYVGWQAAKAQANNQFANFINQAIEDSACADERQSLQALLDEFQDITHNQSTGVI